jgi:hypothetical protein
MGSRQVSLVVGLVFLCACADDAADDSPQRRAACDKLAQARCGHLELCAPFDLEHVRGGMAQCVADEQAVCLNRLAAPGTTLRHTHVTTCATFLAGLACHEIPFGDVLPDDKGNVACEPPPGPTKTLLACGDDSQCATGYCRKASTSACGKCESRKQLGEGCNEDDDCDGFAACAATSTVKKCTKAVTFDLDCTKSECVPPFMCQAGTCVAGGVQGDPCTTSPQNCKQGMGLCCDANTKTCVDTPVVDIGAVCGYIDGSFVVCDYGAACVLKAGGQGTCKKVPAVGEACDSSAAQPCRAPALCTNGKCALSDPRVCL